MGLLLKKAKKLGKGLIYRAYNKITHKSYIGQTKYSLEHRKEGHYHVAWRNNGASTIYFMRALRKYKKNDWVWYILKDNTFIASGKGFFFFKIIVTNQVSNSMCT